MKAALRAGRGGFGWLLAKGARPRMMIAAASGIAAMLWLWIAQADARSAGISGESGKQGTICTECHGGGALPRVSFEGPQQIAAGTTASFRFIVQSQSAAQTHGGLDVAASGGTLDVVPDQGERLLGSDLTHTSPKKNVAGVASWEFTWRAPSAPGSYTLFGAGNSVNRNGNTDGDNAAAATLVVIAVGPATPTIPEATVTPVPTSPPAPSFTVTPTATPSPAQPTPQPAREGDANCDQRLNAADVTAIIVRLVTGEAAGCEFADADCDGAITDEDVVAVVGLLFGAPPALACDTP